MKVPWLPPGHTAVLDGRGEVFYRHHEHADPDAPTLLLLHGWTASADLQFFTAYEALAADHSFVAIDHRGHGRGMRPAQRFELEDAADDAAALITQLGVGPVILVGYSMGGPLSLLLTQRHPALVAGIVVQATALEWNATLNERARWKTVRMLSPILRSWAYPSWLRAGLRRMAKQYANLDPYIEWLAGELSRNSAVHLVHAGQALSRYDAVRWAGELGVPAAMLITTKDHLVRPVKQRALAKALDAFVIELAGDHLSTWMNAEEYAAKTVQLVHHVAARTAEGSGRTGYSASSRG
ncbi:MAG: putative hydrolase [Ilumatobacteraceae bacterium]|nr:putative hydrolase [Ilumatobacteraceae bacterium]